MFSPVDHVNEKLYHHPSHRIARSNARRHRTQEEAASALLAAEDKRIQKRAKRLANARGYK